MAPGTARLALSVLAYSELKSCYGLAWSARVTDEAARGLSLWMVTGTRGFMADGVSIDLKPGDGDVVELGAPLDWSVGEGAARTRRPEGLVEVQAKLAAYQGPNFAAEAERDLRDLEAAVHPLIDAGEYFVCDYGPLPGGGLPRPCRPRAADEAQRRTDRLAFDQEMARRRAVIGDGSLWATLLGSVTPPG